MSLRPPSSTSNNPQRHPPLTLSTPALVAQHTPCTLHPSILPPKLASDVFHTMLAESKDWTRNKWYLFDRLVESPHTTAMYTRSGVGESEEVQDLHKVAAAWYNGGKRDLPRKFPEVVEEACRIVETAVNAEIQKRERFPLEWAGVHPSDGGEKILWRANFCAANLYEGAKETVGFHSDRITSIGPYATIASISLGTTRTFRLREVIPVDEQETRAARTFNIPLSHNSLLIMHGSTQERFKHAVPPQTVIDRFRPQHPPPSSLPDLHVDPGNCRINITFRFYRPDFHPDTAPRCACGETATLRPDMKKRQRETADKGETERRGEGEFRYWWTCTAGDQNEGKTCGFWKVMDVRAEGRGPLVMDL
ncbi:hypothetical protein PENSPDRAFT_673654 [Peniophora sp. CONT]|nr:hypothetical protein PENSPDRAFT_673654 [Peniophora sp. CONT]